MTIPKFKNFNIKPYKPGKSKIKKLKKIIKLSANESALGMSPRAKKIISDKKLKLERYPAGYLSNFNFLSEIIFFALGLIPKADSFADNFIIFFNFFILDLPGLYGLILKFLNFGMVIFLL